MNIVLLAIRFLSGLIVSWPIYYDVYLSKFLMHSTEESMYFGVENDFPLPIGCLSFAIACILSLKLSYIKLIFYQVPVLLIIYFALRDIGVLVYIFVFLYLILIVFKKNIDKITSDFSWFIRGWLLGGIIHVICFGFSNYERILFGSKETPNLFNYQIYSFWVSYSAVMSIFFAAVLITLVKKYSTTLPLIIGPIALSPSYLAARKAVFLDLFLTVIFTIYLMIKRLPIASKKLIIVLLILLVSGYGFYINLSSAREVSISGAWLQRATPYISFINQIFALDPISFLFGYGRGFGGYSNLVLDIFVRGGLVGLLIILVTIVYQLFLLMQIVWKNSDELMKIFVFYLFVNLVVGNIANLNITQPFYIINFLVALMMAVRKRET